MNTSQAVRKLRAEVARLKAAMKSAEQMLLHADEERLYLMARNNMVNAANYLNQERTRLERGRE
jgi:hypothetical protein